MRQGQGSGGPPSLRGLKAHSTHGGRVKKIGILGGMGWPSTAHYYAVIARAAGAHFADSPAPRPVPPMGIESVNIAEARALRTRVGSESYTAYLRAGLERLATVGADFGLIASNTPHQYWEAITDGLEMPMLSILETTARAAAESGRSRAVLLGTPLTMAGRAYPDALRSRGLDVATVSDAASVRLINDLIDQDLLAGHVARSRERLVAIASALGAGRPDTVALLACTELPLAFPEYRWAPTFEADGILWLNTSTVHAHAAFERSVREG